MNSLLVSLKNRLSDFLTHQTTSIQLYVANNSPAVIYVDDASNFNITFAMRNYPQASAYFMSSGSQVKVKLKIKEVDIENNTITLATAPTVNIPVGAVIKRTPNWEEVKGFYLGDPTSIPSNKLPAICVSPVSKDIEWMTLAGLKQHETFNIFVHVQEDNQDNSMITLTRVTEDVVELLNADLHLKIEGRDVAGYNRPYNSLVTSVQYGHSNKGQFCKSSQITWGSDSYWHVGFVTAQEQATFDSFP